MEEKSLDEVLQVWLKLELQHALYCQSFVEAGMYLYISTCAGQKNC